MLSNLLIYLLAICIYFLGKSLFKSFAHFLVRLCVCGVLFFFFLLLSSMSSLCNLDIHPSSDIWHANVSSRFLGCLFILLFFFAVRKHFRLLYFHLLSFASVTCALVSDPGATP